MTALSLFSGAGGMDIGILQAGFEILACVEIDPHCCDTLRDATAREKRNTQILQEDIRTIDPGSLMKSFLMDPGDLDLLVGGSPCQSFSQIGKRGCLDDERGMLLFEFVRFAEAFQPKAILMEQVRGLLSAPDNNGRIGGVYAALKGQLEALGYTVQMETLNSADYGVSQTRRRVFIVATRKGVAFTFPEPTHCDPKKGVGLFGLLPWNGAGLALDGLREPTPKGGYQPLDSHFDVTPLGDRRRISGVPEGSHLARELHLPKEQRCNLSRKDTTKFKRVHREEPSNTLRCGEIFFHPSEDRYLTPREYMRLHGYPDDYLLKGPIRSRSGRVRHLDQHRQVANSVPPPLARIIAGAVMRAIIGALSGAVDKRRSSRTKAFSRLG